MKVVFDDLYRRPDCPLNQTGGWTVNGDRRTRIRLGELDR